MPTPVEILEAFTIAQSEEHIHLTNQQADAFYKLQDAEVDKWWDAYKAAIFIVRQCLFCSAFLADSSPTHAAEGNVAGRHHIPRPDYWS